MAVISRPHAAHPHVDLSALASGLFYVGMAIFAMLVAVPAAIATVG